MKSTTHYFLRHIAIPKKKNKMLYVMSVDKIFKTHSEKGSKRDKSKTQSIIKANNV